MSHLLRCDNLRDTQAVANLYVREDSDRGYLARQVLRLLEWEANEIEELEAALRDAQPWLMVSSDTYPQHHAVLARVHKQVRAALAQSEDAR